MQGRGAGRGRGDRRQIEDGQWDHAISLRIVASIGSYQRGGLARVNPAILLLGAEDAGGCARQVGLRGRRRFIRRAMRFTTTRRTVCDVWVASVHW
jgi:hypothetical protein